MVVLLYYHTEYFFKTRRKSPRKDPAISFKLMPVLFRFGVV